MIPQVTGGFESFVAEYETILTGFQQKGLTLLGYIDKSQNDLIGRMLSLIPTDTLGQVDNQEKTDGNLSGVRDTYLMETLLENPGDRSAIFEVYSRTALSFSTELRLHFFYLNVGAPDRPHLARVEVPAWVANDKEKIALIQTALLDQAQMMGAKPYPYLLHRAHEEALISLDEHQWVEDMISQGLHAGRPGCWRTLQQAIPEGYGHEKDEVSKMSGIEIGRLLRSGTTGFVVGCKVQQISAPSFGAMVRVPLEEGYQVYGLIYDIHIDDDGLVRQLITAENISEEVMRDNRENRTVPVEIGVLALGYEEGGRIAHLLPPRPPLSLDVIYLCTLEEVVRFHRRWPVGLPAPYPA